MATLWRLFCKDWRVFLHDRVSLALTFVVPVVLVAIFGQVFGGRPGSGGTRLALAVLNEADSAFVRSVDGALSSSESFRVVRGIPDPADETGAREIPFTPESLREHVKTGRVRAALWFPREQPEGPAIRARYLFDLRNEIESSIIEGLVQKTVYSQLPDAFRGFVREALPDEQRAEFTDRMAEVIADTFEVSEEEARASVDSFYGGALGEAAGGDGGAAPEFLSQVFELESEQVVGANVRNPGPTRNVGGWSLMFLLFAVSGFAASLFEERDRGLFQRLLSAPVTRSQLLAGKYLFSISLGLVQLLSLFVAGWLISGVDVWANLPVLALVCLCASAASTAFGMLLAAVCRTPAQVSGLATLLILTMSAVGGAWFPTTLMPDAVQAAARLTLVYWAQEGFLLALWRQAPLVDVLPVLGILLGMAALLVAVSLWRFRRGHLL